MSLVEGIPETFRVLKANDYLIAVASSAATSHIERVLERFALKGFVDLVVSGDDVEKAKPAPEIHNEVRGRLPAKQYVVVEDADNGLQSAMSAEMRVMFFNPEQRSSSVEPHMTLRSIREIPRLLKQNGL